MAMALRRGDKPAPQLQLTPLITGSRFDVRSAGNGTSQHEQSGNEELVSRAAHDDTADGTGKL